MSDLGLSLPMGVVQRPRRAVGHGVGRREEWPPRPAIFAASSTMHETRPSPHGYTCVLSTGWEEVLCKEQEALELCKMDPLG